MKEERLVDEIQELLSDDAAGLTGWEVDFLEEVLGLLEANDPLSFRQRHKLVEILEEKGKAS